MTVTLYPSWGVLAQVSLRDMRRMLAPLEEDFDSAAMFYRSVSGWTAMFYMEPHDPAEDAAAKLLVRWGIVPVYRFDFNRYEYMAFRWDGKSWTLERDLGILDEVGIVVPGYDQPPLPASPPIPTREASVVEGATVDEVCSWIGAGTRVEAGPRGAIVYTSDVETQLALWDRAPKRLFEVVYETDSGWFSLKIRRGEDCLGTFVPSETRAWDGTPFLESFEGERDPRRILELLGIEPGFLERSST